MALYYRRGWRGGRYKNDVKSREFDKSVGYELDWPLHYLGKDVSTIDLNEKGGIISDGDEDGYQESMIPDPDPEDGFVKLQILSYLIFLQLLFYF